VYASASGNTEIVCEKIAEVLSAHKYSPQLHRAEQTSLDIISQNPVVIFATSTWDHGRINPFYDKLLAEMQGQDFKHLQAGFVGLGDRRYEPVYFCEGIEILMRTVLGNGAKQIGSIMKINGEPYALLDGEVTNWTRGFIFDLESENALDI
jgi:flavodoxin